jgi:hypothetical protein
MSVGGVCEGDSIFGPTHTHFAVDVEDMFVA